MIRAAAIQPRCCYSARQYSRCMLHRIPTTRRTAPVPVAATESRTPMRLTATAYCHAGTRPPAPAHIRESLQRTRGSCPWAASLRIVQPDHVAGIYTVMDTGTAVKGRMLDIFMPSCEHAIRVRTSSVRVNVLRRGVGSEGPRRRSLNRASLHHEGTKDTTRTRKSVVLRVPSCASCRFVASVMKS